MPGCVSAGIKLRLHQVALAIVPYIPIEAIRRFTALPAGLRIRYVSVSEVKGRYLLFAWRVAGQTQPNQERITRHMPAAHVILAFFF